MSEKFVKKSEKIAFYGVPGEGDAVTYHRMKGFDKIEKSDNPVEHSRTYVDEDFERTDTVGYSPEWACSFDQMVGSVAHDDILSIVDDEIVGSGAVRNIVIVDLTKATTEGSYEARMRQVTVLGDGESRENLYNRSVRLKANGKMIKGTATTTDEWMTATFKATE